MHLFVSYAHADRETITRLIEELRQAGHTVWYDEALYGGQDWWQGILQAIESSQVFLLVVSGVSLGSIYCQAEYRYALALGKPLLPVMLQLLPLPDDLRHIHYSDLTRREGLPRLLADLRRVESSVSPRLLPARRPPLPESPLEKLAKQVETLKQGSASQAYQDQLVSAISKLISREGAPQIRKKAFELLRELGQSPYISDYTSRDIQDILNPSLAHTYPTNLKSLVYHLLQSVKSSDPTEARQARHDLYRLLKHNPYLNETFEQDMYDVLVYELVSIIRQGNPAESHAAREELLSILPPTRLGATLEAELHAALIENFRQDTTWMRRIAAHPHFAEALRPQRRGVWLYGVVGLGVALLLLAALLGGRGLAASEPTRQAEESAPPPTHLAALAIQPENAQLLLTWQDPDWLLIRFTAPQATLDLYDLTFYIEVGNAWRYYRLNQFKQLRENDGFNLRAVPVESCILLGGVVNAAPAVFDGCSQTFFDGKGVPAVAYQPFWAAPLFSVRLNDAIGRDDLLSECPTTSTSCSVPLP